ncbi:hypothetical protein BGX24_000690 [Mortierella sp. AD032]|nr:hypothetical protein BGX24_000690 [Mortierella sp. AD032]
MTHNTTNTTPTHNNNVSADKPSTVDTIKEKAAAVVNKLTGKHHTDDHHTKDNHHHDTATGTHTHDATGTHTHDATGTHTHNATGAQTHDATGTRHTAGTIVGAVPHAASAAVHSTGAGITSGGNIAPPGATQGTAGLVAAATQPLNHQNQHHHVHDATTTDIHNNHHHDHNHGVGGLTTTAPGVHGNNQTHPTAPAGAHLPGTGTGAHQPGVTGTHGTHNVGATDNVTSRLVGTHGDPNNLDPVHIKPTM